MTATAGVDGCCYGRKDVFNSLLWEGRFLLMKFVAGLGVIVHMESCGRNSIVRRVTRALGERGCRWNGGEGLRMVLGIPTRLLRRGK